MASDFPSVRSETIRWIAERTPDYLRISIRASLLGTFLAIAGCVVTALWPTAAGRPTYFVLVWALLAGLGALFVLYLLASAATRRNDPFLSRGFKLAVGCLIPPILASCAVITLLFRAGLPPLVIGPVAAVLYGTCLLSTTAFAPAPILRLGWSFLLVGGLILLALLLGFAAQITPLISLPAWVPMAASFALLHAIHPFAAARKAG